MKLLEFIGFRVLVAIFSLIPFWGLYILSDFTYFIFYYILTYRKNVVISNLRMCFPNKTDEQIKDICKKFYKHLSDISLESIKGMSIREKTLKKRYVIKNQELANNYFVDNKSILCLTSHYGNWEYGILGTNNAIRHQTIALYLPLTNKYTECYGLKRRKRFGMKMVAVQETKSIFNPPPSSPVAVIMAADQSPSNIERAIWVNFLGVETACLHGPEAYAKKTGMPVVYLKISKVKRGYYSLEFEDLIKNPEKCKPNEITNVYFNRLEQDIKNQPEYWLWSHKRWKHKKQKK
ncbi:MAG: lysophospholipid acyltransferase family protein [Bacteroidales bacterium]|nr:lysophospholipid acyltransferase family protein [Bacteroidales bacterium]